MARMQKWQLPDGTPDWSKAPADATMYIAESDDAFESFLKIEGDDLYFMSINAGYPEWTVDSERPEHALKDPNVVHKA